MGQLGRDLQSIMGRPSRELGWFMGAVGIVFLVYLFAFARPLTEHVMLTPVRVLSGEVWQLFTYLFVHRDPPDLIFSLLLVWIFGSVLEKEWGTRKLFVFMAITGVTGAVGMVLVARLVGGLALAVPQGGLGLVTSAMVVAFGLLYPRRELSFFGLVPLEARWLAVGAAALIVLNGLARKTWVLLGGNMVAMGAAALLVTGLWRPRVLWAKLRLASTKRKLGVISGGKPAGGPRYMN
jgi:membrane associated rhomboid family serine protease